MARTVVLILLLDTLPDLDIWNRIFHDKIFGLESNSNSKFEQCQPNIANFILNKVKYGNTENEDWKTNDGKNILFNLTNYIEESARSVSREDVSLDSAPDLNSYSVESIESFNELNDSRAIIENDLNTYNKEHKSGKVDANRTESVVEGASFLVAIFETLSNVTAQTCGGTLLSSHWVITAANCVNVLANLYSNSTNSPVGSSYAVVAGSTNPLLDGSVYNVTEILLSDGHIEHQHRIYPGKHPDTTTLYVQKLPKRNFTLALMRIDPGVDFGGLRIWTERATEKLSVTVYGWTLSKNDSLDAMRATWSSAKITAPTKCMRRSASALCLIMEDALKISSGGAVLVTVGHQTHMLAVLLDDHVPMLAEPLAEHTGWIEQVLKENMNT